MTPRSMALAYRIWADCKTHGWDRTLEQIAGSLGEDIPRIRRIAQMKNWLNRFRAGADHWRDGGYVTTSMDAQLERLGGDHSYPDAEAA